MQMARLCKFTFDAEKICIGVNINSLQCGRYQKGCHDKSSGLSCWRRWIQNRQEGFSFKMLFPVSISRMIAIKMKVSSSHWWSCLLSTRRGTLPHWRRWTILWSESSHPCFHKTNRQISNSTSSSSQKQSFNAYKILSNPKNSLLPLIFESKMHCKSSLPVKQPVIQIRF